MSTTITQRAPYSVSRVTTSLATIPVAVKAKKSASPDGVVRIATSHFALKDVFMERANGQVFANAATATKERNATNVNLIQDARMASAQNHGSVIASKIGVEFSATKVSSTANSLKFESF